MFLSTLLTSLQCLKFKTFSSVFLNRFEALNLSLIQKMQNRRRDPQSTPDVKPEATNDTQPTISTTITPSTTSGIKKKKPKKKK